MVALVSFCLLGICVGIKYYPDSIKVINLLEADAFGLHLMPDRVRSLNSLLDLELEAGLVQGILYRSNEVIYLLVLIRNVPVDLC